MFQHRISSGEFTFPYSRLGQLKSSQQLSRSARNDGAVLEGTSPITRRLRGKLGAPHPLASRGLAKRISIAFLAFILLASLAAAQDSAPVTSRADQLILNSEVGPRSYPAE